MAERYRQQSPFLNNEDIREVLPGRGKRPVTPTDSPLGEVVNLTAAAGSGWAGVQHQE
jgi:hypothetical protein